MSPTISREQASPGAAATDQTSTAEASKTFSPLPSFLEGLKRQLVCPTLLIYKLISGEDSEGPSHLPCVI